MTKPYTADDIARFWHRAECFLWHNKVRYSNEPGDPPNPKTDYSVKGN